MLDPRSPRLPAHPPWHIRWPLLLLLGTTLLWLAMELQYGESHRELAAILLAIPRLTWPLMTTAPMVPIYLLLAPTVVLLVITWFITRIASPQPRHGSRRIVVGLLLLLLARYLIWRICSTLNFADPLTTGLSLGLLAAELLGLSSYSIQLFLLFQIPDRPRSATPNRRAQADQFSQDVHEGRYQPTIDILIPTYDEPAFILQRTIIGIQALDYPHCRVHLLDDTQRREIQILARTLGCEYIARPDRRHAKAGNLNHAIGQTQAELIVCFDADFIPTRNFLQRTVGFFQDPTIGLVQTPQTFYNADPIARNLGLEHMLIPEEEVFYRQIQPMRDAVGSVVCAGTSFVLRRRSIEAIGGFVTDSLSEDYFTAIKLAAQGHRVIYLNEKLSAGLAAENIAAQAVQRLRWARGTLQAFFIPTNPLTIPGLNWKQRLGHLEGILHWFTSLARAYFLLIPLAYVIWGIVPIVASLDEILYFFLPFYFTQLTVFAWLNERSRSALLADIYSLVLLFPLVATIFQSLIRPFAKGFQVTPKGTSSDRFIFNWHLAWPLMLLLIFNAYSLWQTLTSGYDRANGPILDPTLHPIPALQLGWFWSAYNIIMIGIALRILVDVPRPDRPISFALHRRAKLTLDNGQILWGTTTTIGETGCHIALTQGQSEGIHRPVILELPEADLILPAIVVAHPDPTLIQLEFLPLSLAQQRRLIPLLFCRPGQWPHRHTPGERQSLYLLLKVLLQLPRFRTRRDAPPVIVAQD
jgi:cellulose synthase (UDP-forming)